MHDTIANSLEADRRLKIMAELVPLHETIESNSVHLSTLLASCRYPDYVQSSVRSSVDVMKRIVAKSVSAVSRAQQGNTTTSDIALLLELASQSSKIINSTTVQVGKKHDVCHQ